MSDLQKLRKLAEKANPGPWIEKRDPFDVERIHIVDPDDEIICSVRGTTRNSYFIATANPQAIIEILDMLERYREALVRARCEMLIVLENHSKVEMLSPLAIDEALEGGK